MFFLKRNNKTCNVFQRYDIRLKISLHFFDALAQNYLASFAFSFALYLEMFLEPTLVEETLAADVTGPLWSGEIIGTDAQTRQTHLDLMLAAAHSRGKRLVTVKTLELR